MIEQCETLDDCCWRPTAMHNMIMDTHDGIDAIEVEELICRWLAGKGDDNISALCGTYPAVFATKSPQWQYNAQKKQLHIMEDSLYHLFLTSLEGCKAAQWMPWFASLSIIPRLFFRSIVLIKWYLWITRYLHATFHRLWALLALHCCSVRGE